MPTRSASEYDSGSTVPEGKQPFAIQLLDTWVFLTSCFALFVMFGMYKDEKILVCLGLPALSFTLYELRKLLMPTTPSPFRRLWKQ